MADRADFGEGSELRGVIAGLGGTLSAAAELSLLPLACAGAFQLWDDQAADALASRYVRLAREQ